MRVVDLNCDLGEGCGSDAALMPLISSANIACGYHAGDSDTMKRTVDLAMEHNVAIGAHPGYDDRENFGRTPRNLSPSEIYPLVTGQVAALAQIAKIAGGHISHVKPHGALYNQSARSPVIAAAIATAVLDFDPLIILFGLAGSQSILEAEKCGLRTASEVFADRTYQNDGSLTPRERSDAMITDENVAVEQVLDMLKYGLVRSTDAVMVPIVADTVCIHGDGAQAVEFALLIRNQLAENGFRIRRIMP